jgi:predicted Ser/Thr protein kinase
VSPDDPFRSMAGRSLAFDGLAVAAPKLEGPRYRRQALLGVGGMARVYLAVDAQLGREVALKVAETPEGRARLLREAELTALLDHPNVVALHDAGVDETGEPFYVMRLVRGDTFDRVLAGARDLSDRLSWVRRVADVAEAVAFAHDRGVVHRDLKPANVMIGAFGETQVMDWGLAARLGDLRDGDAIVGTPSYLGPEQARGEHVDARVDVFGVAAILYETLTGEPPWGRGDDAVERARVGRRPSVLDRAPATPADLAALVEKGLAFDPSERYASASALAEDLRAWLDGRRVIAHRYTTVELLRRVVAAWRVPLGLLAAATVALAAVVGVAVVRTTAERDRALRAESEALGAEARASAGLSRALTSYARAASEQDRWLDAAVLAATALVEAEDRQARGVLALASARNLPRRTGGFAVPTGRVAVFDGDVVVVRPNGADRVDARGRRETDLRGLAVAAGPGVVYVFEERAAGVSRDGGPTRWERFGELQFPIPEGADVADDGVLMYPFGTEQYAWGLFEERTTAPNPCARFRRAVAAGSGRRGLVVCEDGVGHLLGPGGVEARIPPLPEFGDVVGADLADGVAVIAGGHGAVAIFRTSDVAVIARRDLSIGAPTLVDVDRDGSRVALAAAGGAVVWDLRADVVEGLPVSGVRAMAWRADGGLDVVAETYHRFEFDDARPAPVIRRPKGIAAVAVGDDGEVVVGDGAGDVTWLDRFGRPARVVRPTGHVVKALARRADGVVFAGSTASVHRLDPSGEVRSFGLSARDLDWVGSGLLVSPYDRPFPVLDPDTGAMIRSDRFVSGNAYRAATGVDCRVALGDDGTILSVRGDAAPMPVGTFPEAGDVAVSDDCRLLYLATEGGLAAVDGESGAEVGFVALTHRPIRVTRSPGGGSFAVGTADGAVHVVDEELVWLAEVPASRDRIGGVEFDGDSTLVVVGWDGVVRRLDLGAVTADPVALRDEAIRRAGVDADAILAR